MADQTQVAYYLGLDMGPVGQFTGMAIVEKTSIRDDEDKLISTSYAVRHLARFPPGTPYGTLIDEVRRVLTELPKKVEAVLFDQTAVGHKVFRTVRDALRGWHVRGVMITAGMNECYDSRQGFMVPKIDLVGILQLLLQERRFRVATALELASTLTEELQQFQIRTLSSMSDSVLEWRERPHDDLVLAVAIAIWYAERPGIYIAVV